MSISLILRDLARYCKPIHGIRHSNGGLNLGFKYADARHVIVDVVHATCSMGPGGGIANTVVLLACIYFVGKIDFTDADNLLRLRVTYGIVQALTLAAFAYVYMRITTVADRTAVTLADGTRTTVMDYDLSKLKEFVRGTLMGTGISLFIHLKMGVVPPLFIQSVMAPIQTGQNALVRLHLLGDRSAELVNRPWKEPPSPFAALLGQQPADAAAAPADGPAPDAAPAEQSSVPANSTAAEDSVSNNTEAAAEETKTEEAPKPEPVAAKEDKKPTSTKKGKSKNKPAAAATSPAPVAVESTETAASAEAVPAATEAPAAATTPAVSTLSESQEEPPASPSADSPAKTTANRRRKTKAEQ